MIMHFLYKALNILPGTQGPTFRSKKSLLELVGRCLFGTVPKYHNYLIIISCFIVSNEVLIFRTNFRTLGEILHGFNSRPFLCPLKSRNLIYSNLLVR